MKGSGWQSGRKTGKQNVGSGTGRRPVFVWGGHVGQRRLWGLADIGQRRRQGLAGLELKTVSGPGGSELMTVSGSGPGGLS